MAKKTRKNLPSPPFSPTEILKLLKTRQEQGLTLGEMAEALGVDADRRRELRWTLQELIDQHKISKLGRRNYGLPPKGKVIVGRLQAHQNGFGFLIPEDPKVPDIFLGKREIQDLMHRDRVALHFGKKERGRKHAPRVLEVLERAYRRVVGRYEESGEAGFVVPDDYRITQNIHIPQKAAGGARNHQIVLAEINRYPTKKAGPEGRILKVLGDLDDPRLDAEIIIHKHDLPDEFPPAVIQEAEGVPDEIFEEEIARREDLRDLNFFTVDGEKARDFDDAVAIARRKGGCFTLWVAIADVGHYVREGSDLDQEAFRRGTSVYFPERALPMLPPRLSNGICSLNPQEDRMAMTAALEFNRQGQMTDARFFPSVIRSQARLTYTMVRETLADGRRELPSPCAGVYEDLKAMAELCQMLRSRRTERGSLDFDLPEPEIILDVQGQIEEIVRAERHIGHQMIEEFMIATNEAVARYLSQEETPALHRVHELPDVKKMEEFKEFVGHLGYRLAPKGKLQAKIFQRLLEQVRGKPEEKSVNYLLLRSMRQARYSEEGLGHFALASAHYLHFTSPIRRYPDLIVHRILKEVLHSGSGRMNEKRRQRWQKRLPEIAEHSSQRERTAMEAEREIVERKKVQFMRDRIGQEFNGYISGVLPFGIFVELEDFFIEGLVHITRLPADQYEFLERKHTLLGKRGKKSFRLGDRVRVRVDAANLERRQVDFSLVPMI